MNQKRKYNRIENLQTFVQSKARKTLRKVPAQMIEDYGIGHLSIRKRKVQ